MAVHIRKNGRILCAAMHPKEPGDTYIDDTLHQILSVDTKVLVTDDNHINGHGEWWWRGNVPEGINISGFYRKGAPSL